MRGKVKPPLQRFNFEGGEDGLPGDKYLAFDPMRLQEGVTVARHISHLKTCFQAAWAMEDIWSHILENGIRNYYLRKCSRRVEGTIPNPELNLFTAGSFYCHCVDGEMGNQKICPSLATFADYFVNEYMAGFMEKVGAAGAGGDWINWLRGWTEVYKLRFDNLLDGLIGTAAARADRKFLDLWNESRWDELMVQYGHFGKLLTNPSVIELDGIVDNEEKSLMMAFLLVTLFEIRQHKETVRRTEWQ